MSKKSFFLGVLTGAVLTFAVLLVIGLAKSSDTEDPIQYLDQPESYESKTVTSFKVLQVLGNAALAREVSSKVYNLYTGNTVMILGENFYSDQIVTIKNPMRVGTYSYTNNGGMPMTVPVLDGRAE